MKLLFRKKVISMLLVFSMVFTMLLPSAAFAETTTNVTMTMTNTAVTEQVT